MKEIGFQGKKYPLNWDIYAHDRILQTAAEKGFTTIGDWMEKAENEAYGIILYELICGGIRRHNFEVSMGFKGGKRIKMPDLPPEERKNILSCVRANDMVQIKAAVSMCWNEARHAEVPEELKKYMPDDDYLEIAAEIEKNSPESEKN